MECKHAKEPYSECGGEVIYRADPFNAEIYDDFTKVYMCEAHRQMRAEDI